MSGAAAVRVLDGVEVPVAGVYEIDPAHSEVAFVARHLVFSKVRGRFERFNAVVTIGSGPEDSGVEATIEAASITTGSAQRDEHLRSGDFLDVASFPALRFRSTAVERTGQTSLLVHGDLTIRDVTRPVTLSVAYEGAGTDPWGNARAAFTATTEIDREDFGITWNQALETGGVLVGKKVTIELSIAAVRAS